MYIGTCYCRSSSAKSIESVGIVGTAEKSFLSQTKEQEEEAVVPTLDEFDAEIDIYRVSVGLLVLGCMYNDTNFQLKT